MSATSFLADLADAAWDQVGDVVNVELRKAAKGAAGRAISKNGWLVALDVALRSVTGKSVVDHVDSGFDAVVGYVWDAHDPQLGGHAALHSLLAAMRQLSAYEQTGLSGAALILSAMRAVIDTSEPSFLTLLDRLIEGPIPDGVSLRSRATEIAAITNTSPDLALARLRARYS